MKRSCKCVTDFSLAALGLLFLMPLFLTICIFIYLDNPGPIFFRQERVGYRGKRFKILKFRTMVVNADALLESLSHLNESKDGVLFKIKGRDPRITRVGRWLRKSSLDELPQLFNILWGDMAIIGPRALSIRDYNLMPEQYRDRNNVKPGLLCYWQLYSGDRWSLSFDEVYLLDKKYVDSVVAKGWCPMLDFSMMLKAVNVVTRGLNY